MEILLIGLNHKTAPVHVRECFAFDKDQAKAALESLAGEPALAEVYLLSTCNRVEVLLAARDPQRAQLMVKRFLSREKKVKEEDFSGHLYVYQGEEACRHIMRVASSLDSMVVGEPQILGQVKDGYRMAIATKSSGVLLNRLLHKTFAAAKRVRRETGIGDSAVSISYAAVELAKKIFGELSGKKVLLVGAGEMAELAVEHLIRHQARELFVANRTFERAVELAGRFNGTPIRFEELFDYLQTVDIIISSTGATNVILRAKDVKSVMRKRKNKPLFFIDIAVPRDIDPAINKISNAYLYDIDDLTGVIEHNREERLREAQKAERIIDEAVIHFLAWVDSLDIVPTIRAMHDKLEAISRLEMEKTFHHETDFTEEQRQAVERLTQSIINKALHDPIQFLKAQGHRAGKKQDYLGLARDLFGLDTKLGSGNKE